MAAGRLLTERPFSSTVSQKKKIYSHAPGGQLLAIGARSVEPIHRYRRTGKALDRLEEFLTKAVMFSPVGLIVRRPALAALAGAAVAMVLEVGQLFVSTRFPCVTDAIIGALGAYIAAGLPAVLHTEKR